ncbi:DivIVA domain-containing protein [Spirosoma sp. RP8]|uniref:DivIVA domain-containing protein n=1 Tax=Spirosoma liriopis TaxID=2937440 RepID=A0ABT0HJK0_9BACT|nr:DivIVA domain-containing protein [Spirosoma liriopis]MCK8492341.1 DivIVA domain-containing protein [Spirosoma liriopis]
MKITPIEIRQHTFERGLRGYKSEDVDAFLVSLSQEWERVTGEHKMLKMQLELAEKELGKLKEVEMTLFRTLKTAEDTSTQITDQATKAAEQYMAEARQRADDMLAEARKKSTLMVQDAENQSRFLKENILNDLKVIEHDFKALEGYKENLATQIRSLASGAIDSVDRFEKKFLKQDLKGKIDEVSTQINGELKKADEEQSVRALPMPSEPATPVDELPELVERETAIPEAIPIDEPVIARLDDAVHEEMQPENASLPVAQPEPAFEKTAPESTLAEVNTAEPAIVVEETQPKKGGSFFDQI